MKTDQKALKKGNEAPEGGAQPESDLPASLVAPAKRALAGAGYTRLEELSQTREAEILKLHGMGPKAMEQLRRALADKGLSFARSE